MAGRADRDTTGRSGWLYTDLLLGLTVIFLGTVSFVIPALSEEVPENGGVPATTTTTIPTRVEAIFYKESLKGFYDVAETSRLDKDIANFISSKKITGNPKVALVLIYGRIQANESEGIGTDRAKAAYARIQNDLPTTFNEDVAVRPLGSKSLGSNSQVKIELFFTYERAVEIQ